MRGFFLGLALVGLTCFVVSYTELVVKSIQIGFLQMPPAVIGMFLFLVLINRAMRRLGARLALRSADLLMIYCMMLVAAMISSRGVMEKIIPLLVTSNYFANPTNRWHELFSPHTKKWMVAFDPAGPPQQFVSKRFFEGLRAGEPIPWSEWAVPLAAWGMLVLLVVFAFLCIATILRKQWVENERLNFPLVQLPVALAGAGEGADMLRNRLLWGGAALPAAVFTLNGLHNAYPNVPEIGLAFYVTPLLVTYPWTQMYWTTIYLSFAAVGFFFLLPADLLFSLWFFALFARLQDVVAASYGMPMEAMPMYGTHAHVAYQVAGAYFVLAGYMLYAAGPHLRRVARAAFTKQGEAGSDEMLPYRTAVWGLLGAFALIMAWCCAAGMSLWLAALEFSVFLFIVALVMARSTADAGLLMTETSFRPTDIYRMFAPPASLGAANITALAFLDGAFMRDQRGLLLTGFLDGLKMSDGAKTSRKTLLLVLTCAVLAALVIAGAIHVWLPYDKGGLTLYSYVYQGNNLWTFHTHGAQMAETKSPSWQGRTFFVVGVVVALFLSYMRSAFFWWPLHPLGYALCISWTMSVFWFSCLVAWLLKSVVLRYGGMKLYIKARPWFLGMILGEFGAAVLWALISGLTGSAAPAFPWP